MKEKETGQNYNRKVWQYERAREEETKEEAGGDLANDAVEKELQEKLEGREFLSQSVCIEIW